MINDCYNSAYDAGYQAGHDDGYAVAQAEIEHPAPDPDHISKRKLLNHLTCVRRHLILETDRQLLDRIAMYVGKMKEDEDE